MSDFRSSYRWKRLRKHVIASSNGICGICGDPVDLRLSGNHKRGPTVDHIVAVADGGAIWDRSNLRGPVHRECNEAKERDTRKRLRDAAAGRPFVSATAPAAVAPDDCPLRPFDPANPGGASREWGGGGGFSGERAAWLATPPPFLTQSDLAVLAVYIKEHDT